MCEEERKVKEGGGASEMLLARAMLVLIIRSRF